MGGEEASGFGRRGVTPFFEPIRSETRPNIIGPINAKNGWKSHVKDRRREKKMDPRGMLGGEKRRGEQPLYGR